MREDAANKTENSAIEIITEVKLKRVGGVPRVAVEDQWAEIRINRNTQPNSRTQKINYLAS